MSSPTLEANERLLGDVGAESVNSVFSPLGHTIHNMNKVFTQLAVHQCIEAAARALNACGGFQDSVIILRVPDPWGLDLTSIYLKLSEIISNYLIFASNAQKDAKNAKRCKQVQKTCKKVQKHAKKCKNMQKSAKTCKKVQKCKKVQNCNKMQKCNKIQKIQKECKNNANIHDTNANKDKHMQEHTTCIKCVSLNSIIMIIFYCRISESQVIMSAR